MHLVVCHKQATTWGHFFFSGQCVAQKGMDIYADACGSISIFTFEGDVSPRRTVMKSMLMWCARTCLLGGRAHVPTWSPVCAAHKHCGTDLQCARIPGQPSVHEQGLLAHNYESTPGTNAHMCMRAWPVQTVQYERNPNTVTQPASQPAIHPQQVNTPSPDDPSLVCLPTTSCAQ